MENLDYEEAAHAIDEKLRGYSADEISHVLSKLSAQSRERLLEAMSIRNAENTAIVRELHQGIIEQERLKKFRKE